MINVCRGACAPLLCLLLAGTTRIAGQDAAPAATRPAAGDAAAPRGQVVADPTHGYELALPADWRFDAAPERGPGRSLRVLRASPRQGAARLQVLIFREPDNPKFAQWLAYFKSQLEAVTGTTAVRADVHENAPRPEAYLTADGSVGADAIVTFYYCVQFDISLFWVLSYAQPLAKDADAERAAGHAAFARIAGSMRVWYDPVVREQLDAALARGREFRRLRLKPSAGKARIDETPLYYEIRSGDRPLGFLARTFTREKRSLDDPEAADEKKPAAKPGEPAGVAKRRKSGLRLSEREWRFGEGGAVAYVRRDAFSSDDLDTELLEIVEVERPARSEAARPDAAGPPGAAQADASIVSRVQQCVREADTLFVTWRTSEPSPFADPGRSLPAGENFVGLAWLRLMPGLLGGEPGEPFAFESYDPHSRSLATYVVRPLGKQALPGATGDAYAFELRTGFSPQLSLVWIDPRGRPLRIESGDTTLVQLTREQVEQRYGLRRDEAARDLRISTP